MDEQSDQSSTYLKQMFSSRLVNLDRRVLQLDDTLTTISDKLADMDKRSEEVVKVVRETGLAEGALESLMRRNACYALFVWRAAETFLLEQMRWSEDERNCSHANPAAEQDLAQIDQENQSNGFRDKSAMRNEESYRALAEEDIYGYGNNVRCIQTTGDRDSQYRTYLSLLWSLTGQKFRRRQDSDSNEDGPSCCCRWKWCPSGFDLVEILGIVYHSMPQDERLRRLFIRVIDAEMLRRKDADPQAKDATTIVPPGDAWALIERSGTADLLLQRQEDGGCGKGVSRDYEPAAGGDIEQRGRAVGGKGGGGRGGRGVRGRGRGERGGSGMRGRGRGRGGVERGGGGGRAGESGGGERAGGGKVTRSSLHFEGTERGASNASQTTGSSEWLKEGRIGTVAGRRPDGRLINRKSQYVGVNANKRQPKEEVRLKRPKKKSELVQADSHKAAALARTIEHCPEGLQLQVSHCPPLAQDDVGAAGESLACHQSRRPEPSVIRSSASYTLCTSPRGEAATFSDQTGQRVAEHGANGPRAMKPSLVAANEHLLIRSSMDSELRH